MTEKLTFAAAQRAPIGAGLFAGRHINYRIAARRLLHGALRAGHAVDALLAESGISEHGLHEKEGSISRIELIRLIKAARRHLDDEFLGLTEHRCAPGAFAFMAEIALHCSTLAAVLEQSTRFYRMVTRDLEFRLVVGDDDITLQCMAARPELDPGSFLVDYNLLQWHRMLSWMVGYMIPVKRVELVSADRPGPDRLAYFIRGDWRPCAPINAITISLKYLTLPVIRTKAELSDYFTRGAEGGFVWPDGESSWTANVKARFLHALAHRSSFELDQVAANLNVSGHSLRRHLRHEGSGYQKLLDEFRRDVAIEKLHVQHVSVADVAALLGFSEPRSFTRAFKQWTGVPPSAYVARLAR